jgi:50S ribosomal subunit-associated GTPase HflX
LPGKSPRKEVALVTYPDSFTLEEAKSLVDSAGRKTLRVFTQKYLNHTTEYGIGSGKAKELEELVKESNAEQVIIVDEHLTSKQIHIQSGKTDRSAGN